LSASSTAASSATCRSTKSVWRELAASSSAGNGADC
jgi:hypothetical protein